MQVKGLVVVDGGRLASRRVGGGSRAAIEQVANRPIIHHVVDALEAVGIDDVTVVAPADGLEDVRECLRARRSPRRLNYIGRPAPFEPSEAFSAAAPLIGSAPCLAHLATGLLGDPLMALMDQVGADSPDLVVTVHQCASPVRRLSAPTHAMLRVADLHPERSALSTAGVCFFGPGALARAGGASWRAGEEIDLTMVADRIETGGGRLEVLLVEDWQRYEGDPVDLLELNRIALDRLAVNSHLPGSNGNRIEGRVWVHEQASVRQSVIVGPAVIGPGAHVSDAYIGPYTSIGPDATIEGAEIERSIIAAGASITHVGGRMVASVVGRDARIFRDFSLPRALRLRVGDRTEVALC